MADKSGLHGKQLQAAYLLGYGRTHTAAAEAIGVNVATLQRWLLREDFRALRDEHAEQAARELMPRALELLRQQTERGITEPDHVGKGWLAQGAAGRVMQYAAQARAREQGAQVLVTFANVPAPGLPPASDAVAEDPCG